LTLVELIARRGFALATLHLVAALAIVVGAVGWLLSALGTGHQAALSHFMVFGTVFILGANLFFNFRLWLSAVSSATSNDKLHMRGAFFLQTDLVGASCCRPISRIAWCCRSTFPGDLAWSGTKLPCMHFGRKFRNRRLSKRAKADGNRGYGSAHRNENRRAIIREFSEMRNEWATDDDEIGLILIDVDYFKRFNDGLGHQAGDDCLIKLAHVLSETAASEQCHCGSLRRRRIRCPLPVTDGLIFMR